MPNAAVTVNSSEAKVSVVTRSGTGREQLIRLSVADLQSHLGKGARMGRMLALKARSAMVSVQGE